MGRDPKHTPEMREAIVRAVAVDGHTADQVVELAAAGQLAGLPPFEVARSTVYDLVGKAKRDGEIIDAQGENESTIRSRKVAEATIARVEALGDHATGKDLAAMREAARIARDADKAKRPVRILQPRPNPSSSDSFVGHLMASHLAWTRADAEGVSWEARLEADEAAIAAYEQAAAAGASPEASVERARDAVDAYDWAHAPRAHPDPPDPRQPAQPHLQ